MTENTNLFQVVKELVTNPRESGYIMYKPNPSEATELDFEELKKVTLEIEAFVSEESLPPSSGYLLFTSVFQISAFWRDIPQPVGESNVELIALQAINHHWF